MRYFEPVFRPPSEADSLILQVTVGCSYGKCVFCAMYRNKSYFVRPLKELLGEIREAATGWPGCPRVFLGDGDALAAPTGLLLEILEELNRSFPRLRRVSLYATAINLLEKSAEELHCLRQAGLTLFYLGLESGSAKVLRAMGKGVTPEESTKAVLKGREASLNASVMVLLGLGGVKDWEEHAVLTAEVCSAMQPEYLSALTWRPVKEAPLYRRIEKGMFTVPGDSGILRELKVLISKLSLRDTVFRANHASNPLPIGGRLSRDRDRLLDVVAAAEQGLLNLQPDCLRGV